MRLVLSQSIKGVHPKREAGPEGKRRNSGRKSSVESNKRRHNLLTVLELTNATPIKNKVGRGYECVYCVEVFLDPSDLKMHTAKDHSDDKIKYKYFKKMLYANSAKLDITSLQCTLCHLEIGGLNELYLHLNKEHNKKIYTDIKDKLLPFKFEERDVARCVICSETFASFKMLLSHMNIHYRNYICDVCETGFVTERLLKSHFRESHQRGEYKCGICAKVFSTITKKKDHEKCVHFGLKKNKCPYCPARFVNYIKKNTHISEVHNKPCIVYNCHACEKSFDAHVKLSTHIKRDHLMERKYECSECDMNFFEKDSLTEHMVKHTGEKHFACGVCYKTFGRKKTLREHMRIHNNDRRFKCEECSHAFVQKCAWRSHMKTKHNLTV
ncbi:Zinc finger protein 26 [Eumeta japonica]|uniref:Zinc finger protein 26 n=1 Tax=Eumeta variegata TaxID=151549 RepID=A0A4C1VVI1_EUMVA|nr:Zinc finger protein 26 [Eumeta japonica]